MHDSLSQEEGGSEADDESTSVRRRCGGGVMDEEDERLDRLIDLDVTWRVDLHAFLRARSHVAPAASDAGDLRACLQERSQEAPVADDAGDGTVATMISSHKSAVQPPSVPARRAETVETVDSFQGGTVDASSVPAGRAESASDASAAPGTDQGNGDGSPAVLSCRAAHEPSSWGQLPLTVLGRTRGQSQRLQDGSAQRRRVMENATSAVVQKWTDFGGILANSSWMKEDAMTMMAGGPAVGQNIRESNVCMPSGFPEDIEPPPQSVADVERFQ